MVQNKTLILALLLLAGSASAAPIQICWDNWNQASGTYNVNKWGWEHTRADPGSTFTSTTDKLRFCLPDTSVTSFGVYYNMTYIYGIYPYTTLAPGFNLSFGFYVPKALPANSILSYFGLSFMGETGIGPLNVATPNQYIFYCYRDISDAAVSAISCILNNSVALVQTDYPTIPTNGTITIVEDLALNKWKFYNTSGANIFDITYDPSSEVEHRILVPFFGKSGRANIASTDVCVYVKDVYAVNNGYKFTQNYYVYNSNTLEDLGGCTVAYAHTIYGELPYSEPGSVTSASNGQTGIVSLTPGCTAVNGLMTAEYNVSVSCPSYVTKEDKVTVNATTTGGTWPLDMFILPDAPTPPPSNPGDFNFTITEWNITNQYTPCMSALVVNHSLKMAMKCLYIGNNFLRDDGAPTMGYFFYLIVFGGMVFIFYLKHRSIPVAGMMMLFFLVIFAGEFPPEAVMIYWGIVVAAVVVTLYGLFKNDD